MIVDAVVRVGGDVRQEISGVLSRSTRNWYLSANADVPERRRQVCPESGRLRTYVPYYRNV